METSCGADGAEPWFTESVEGFGDQTTHQKMSELQVFKQAEWVDPENRFVFWSGGKDSTVALHLALRAWKNPKVVFIDTGITIPETLEYVRHIAEEWNLNLTVLKPTIDFWDYVAKNGFPIPKGLWCRRLLKIVPIKKFMKKQHGWKVEVMGIRSAESSIRKKAWYYQTDFGRHTIIPYTYNLLPILNWTSQQIENYIVNFQIPTNPAYEKYFTSGCYFCPFVSNPKHYLALKRNHPELFFRILEAERVMRRGKTPWAEKSIIPVAEQQFLER